jgi:hypothetical protein
VATEGDRRAKRIISARALALILEEERAGKRILAKAAKERAEPWSWRISTLARLAAGQERAPSAKIEARRRARSRKLRRAAARARKAARLALESANRLEAEANALEIPTKRELRARDRDLSVLLVDELIEQGVPPMTAYRRVARELELRGVVIDTHALQVRHQRAKRAKPSPGR